MEIGTEVFLIDRYRLEMTKLREKHFNMLHDHDPLVEINERSIKNDPSEDTGFSLSNGSNNEFYYDEDFSVPFDVNLTETHIQMALQTESFPYQASSGSRWSEEEMPLSPYLTVVGLTGSEMEAEQSSKEIKVLLDKKSSNSLNIEPNTTSFSISRSLPVLAIVDMEKKQSLREDVSQNEALKEDVSQNEAEYNMQGERLITWANVGNRSVKSPVEQGQDFANDVINSDCSEKPCDNIDTSQQVLVTWAGNGRQLEFPVVMEKRLPAVLESNFMGKSRSDNSIKNILEENSKSSAAMGTDLKCPVALETDLRLCVALETGMTTWGMIKACRDDSSCSSEQASTASVWDSISGEDQGHCPHRRELSSSPASKDDGYDSSTRDLSINGSHSATTTSSPLLPELSGAEDDKEFLFPDVEIPDILKDSLIRSGLYSFTKGSCPSGTFNRDSSCMRKDIKDAFSDVSENRAFAASLKNATRKKNSSPTNSGTVKLKQNFDSLRLSVCSSAEDSEASSILSPDVRQVTPGNEIQISKSPECSSENEKQQNVHEDSKIVSKMFPFLQLPLPDLSFLRKGQTTSKNKEYISSARYRHNSTSEPILDVNYDMRDLAVSPRTPQSVRCGTHGDDCSERRCRIDLLPLHLTVKPENPKRSDFEYKYHSWNSFESNSEIKNQSEDKLREDQRQCGKSVQSKRNFASIASGEHKITIPDEIPTECTQQEKTDTSSENPLHSESLVINVCNACNARTVRRLKEPSIRRSATVSTSAKHSSLRGLNPVMSNVSNSRDELNTGKNLISSDCVTYDQGETPKESDLTSAVSAEQTPRPIGDHSGSTVTVVDGENSGSDQARDEQALVVLTDEQPPADFMVSFEIEMSNTDKKSFSELERKKDLLLNVLRSVELVLCHFDQKNVVKADLGSTQSDSRVGLLVLRHLCPAIYEIILDGMRPELLSYFGKVKNSVRQVIEDSATIGQPPNILKELVMSLKSLTFLSTPWLYFNAFVFALLNCKVLDVWLSYIRSNTTLLDKHYDPRSFLRLNNSVFSRQFHDVLAFLQPFALLPFRLEYSFEVKLLEKQKQEHLEKRIFERHLLLADACVGAEKKLESEDNQLRCQVQPSRREECRIQDSPGTFQENLARQISSYPELQATSKSLSRIEIPRVAYQGSHLESRRNHAEKISPPTGSTTPPEVERNLEVQRLVNLDKPLNDDEQTYYDVTNALLEIATHRSKVNSSTRRNVWSFYDRGLGRLKNILDRYVFRDS